MRWSIVSAAFLATLSGWLLYRSPLDFEVSTSDGVIHPADRVHIRCEGTPFLVLLRVDPDHTIDVIRSQPDQLDMDAICPITEVAGQTSFVALGFAEAIDTESTEWRRQLLDFDDPHDVAQWKQRFPHRNIRIRSFPTPLELRTLNNANVQEQVADYVRITRACLETARPKPIARIVKHVSRELTEWDHLPAESLRNMAWLLLSGGEAEHALSILRQMTFESVEEEAFRDTMTGMCHFQCDRFEDACRDFARAIDISSDESLAAHCLILWSRAKLALGEPESVVAGLRPVLQTDGRAPFSYDLNETNHIVGALSAALEELGRIDAIQKLTDTYSVPSLYGWMVQFGHHREASRMLAREWRHQSGNVTLALATDLGMAGVDRDIELQNPVSVPILEAPRKIARANLLMHQGRFTEARRLVTDVDGYYRKIGYRGIDYANAKSLLANLTLHADPVEAVRLSRLCLEREQHARYGTAHRVGEAEWLYGLALAATGSVECLTHLNRAIELASNIDTLDSGQLIARAQHLCSYFEGSPEAAQRRLDLGLDVAAREMLRWDRPRATANLSLLVLWHYLSKSQLPPKELYQRIRPFAAWTLDGTRPWRRDDAALVDIFFYYRANTHFSLPDFKRRPHYVAFIEHRGEVSRVELGDGNSIDEAVRKWRQTMSDRQDPRAAAQAVRRVLWEPLASHLPASAKTLFISGDWEMASVPWEAIPLRPSGHREQVMDHWKVERLAASRNKRLKPELQWTVADALGVPSPDPPRTTVAKPALDDGAASARWLLIGDVDFGADPQAPPSRWSRSEMPEAPRFPWRHLKGTAKEIELIQSEARRQCDVLRGAEATKSRVVELLPEAEIVHFATHAFANAQWSSLSAIETGGVLDQFGLALAGANQSSLDGLLTATEVSRLKMPRLKLAVLSGCETGIGRPVRDQHFGTLHRAFLKAGAKHVLASMWRVDDDAAQRMITKFYQHYLKGELSPSEALRQAQWEIRGAPASTATIALRGPDFSKGPQPLTQRPSTHRSPDWVWAAWYVSSLSWNDATSSPNLAPTNH